MLTYELSRSRFLDVARSKNLELLSFPVAGRTPQGGPLFQDVAILRRAPYRVTICMSGVHGTEGYFGSSVQSQQIENLDTSPTAAPSDTSLCWIHAMNPYGMAWYKRTNQKNIDLNRNGFDFTQALPEIGPGYDRLKSWLHQQTPGSIYVGAPAAIAKAIISGFSRTAFDVAKGQYQYEEGLFYGGLATQPEVMTIHQCLVTQFPVAKEWYFMDLHTGLGPFAKESLLTDSLPSQIDFFERVFGCRIQNLDTENQAYRAHGLLADYFTRCLPGEIYYMTHEFGTLSFLRVLMALMQEPSFPMKTAADHARKQQFMLSHFYPSDSSWRKNTMELALLRWNQLVHSSF